MSLRFAVVLACLMVCSSPPRSVLAQDAEATRAARTLFEQGLAQVDARAWSEAAHSFRQALLLRDSPVIRYNLAVALIELHALREAEQLLRGVLRDVETPVAVRAKLAEQLEVIDRRSAKLTVRLDEADDAAEVLLDERVLLGSELNTPQRLDPGPHTVRLRRGGLEIDTRHLELAEGDNQQLLLVHPIPARAPEGALRPVATPAEVAAAAALPAASSAAAQPAVPVAAVQPAVPVAATGADDGARAKKRRRWWGIGASVLAVTAGSVTGIVLATRSEGEKPYEGDFSPPVIGVRVPQ